MRIAFVSHEFPPDTGGGGIGTYLDQIAPLLVAAGHSVDVFCGSRSGNNVSTRTDGVRVHRIAAATGTAFRSEVLPVFWAMQAVSPFDVVEATDFDAPANALKRALPALPLVVKLHTPRFIVDELHHQPATPVQRLRIALGALRRGRWPRSGCAVRARPEAQAELEGLHLADEIAAPSQAIARAAAEWVPATEEKTSVFPYPYLPSPALLALDPGADTRRVLFLGRLELRKGVVDLVDAIPHVLAAFPAARFRFVGRSMPSLRSGESMEAFLRRRVGAAGHAVEFTGPVPAGDVVQHLAAAAILVAPSHWESFGLVCCEGLAAARAVIGSSAGGMTEILDHGRCGLLVPPRSPSVVADAIVHLLSDRPARLAFGSAGRQHVLNTYTPKQVLPQHLASYERAIARCRASAGSR
jgi:glycogen synthase